MRRALSSGTAFVAMMIAVGAAAGATAPPDTDPPTTIAPLATFEGSDTDVVDLGAPLHEGALLDVTYGSGSFDSFTAQGLTAEVDDTSVFIFSIGAGVGRFLIRPGEAVQYLQIESSGSWTVTVQPLAAARHWDGAAIEGTGNDVLLYTGAPGLVSFTVEAGVLESMILVSYTPDGADLEEFITTSIGSASGTAAIPAGPQLIDVGTPGAWTLEVEPLE